MENPQKTAIFSAANPHKILTRLIALNIVFDIIAIVIWGGFPATQWSIYRLGFLIVGPEAAIAAGLFGLVLFGLIKNKKWAPVLTIVLTVTQRIFATYVFLPSLAIIATLIWSLIIIYFAYRDLTHRSNKKTFEEKQRRN